MLFNKILELRRNESKGYKNECSAILSRIFAECCKDSEKTANNSKIEASLDYINQNYLSADISVPHASSLSFMSEVYFRRLFKEQFGTTQKNT